MHAKNKGVNSIDLENAEKIKLTSAISPVIPIFTYESPNFKRHCDGSISVGKEVIYTILDDKEFGEALGFKGFKEQNITFDEYIWERYTIDGAQRTKHCMQVQLNAFLFKHSTKFKDLYGAAYKKLIADNNFICIDEINALCDNCAHL